jgi:hypothetical protein
MRLPSDRDTPSNSAFRGTPSGSRYRFARSAGADSGHCAVSLVVRRNGERYPRRHCRSPPDARPPSDGTVLVHGLQRPWEVDAEQGGEDRPGNRFNGCLCRDDCQKVMARPALRLGGPEQSQLERLFRAKSNPVMATEPMWARKRHAPPAGPSRRTEGRRGSRRPNPEPARSTMPAFILERPYSFRVVAKPAEGGPRTAPERRNPRHSRDSSKRERRDSNPRPPA